MFVEEEQIENGMRAAVDFLNADTNVRNALINNIMQSGDKGLQQIGDELSRLMRRRGINLDPEVLTKTLSKTYEFGFLRYMGEYDNSSLSERDIFNDNVEVDSRGMDNAMQRKRKITLMVNDLDCSNHHVPNCWADFVNRGYSDVKKIIDKKFGDEAVDTFEYYCCYEAKDILKTGLTGSLTRAYVRTVEQMQYLNTATLKLEENVVEAKSSTRTAAAAMFK